MWVSWVKWIFIDVWEWCCVEIVIEWLVRWEVYVLVDGRCMGVWVKDIVC